jgi:hypothetical protein
LSDSKTFTVLVAELPAAVINNGGGTISLSFPTIQGKNYKVQYKDDLNAPTWTDLAPGLTASGSTANVSDNIGTNHQRFYRIFPQD